jgi:hypothetical protein
MLILSRFLVRAAPSRRERQGFQQLISRFFPAEGALLQIYCKTGTEWSRTLQVRGRTPSVRVEPILLQNDFWRWNEEQFSRTRIKS